MLQMLAFVLILAPAAAGAQSIYRCTAPNGSVTMQQTPCPTGANSAPVTVRSAPPTPPTADEQRRNWIVWSNDPQTDAVRVTANLDAIRALGRQCESLLKAGGGDLQPCRRFLAQLAPTGDYGRVVEKAQQLGNAPGPSPATVNAELRKARVIADDIVRLKEFTLAALPQR